MRPLLALAVLAMIVLPVVYGEVCLVRFFVDWQVCVSEGQVTTCRWVLDYWSPPARFLAFLVYLPLSLMISVWFAWPGCAIGALIDDALRRAERHTRPRKPA